MYQRYQNRDVRFAPEIGWIVVMGRILAMARREGKT
jgi:hypothetical protein